ncbi:MAG TPA: lamin tail domain-containing protein [Candidatus Angelobacter sp.]|nr:lamin tail domain-containing protein [Candidatus Angelobacter sp.]
MHVHRDPTRTDDARDTASAISGGVDFVGQNSDWTIINNIFYDVDHVFLNKGNSTTTGNGGGRVALLYNTILHVAREGSGSPESDIAAFDWTDDGIALPDANIGSGLYAAHNIIHDCAVLNLHYDPAHHTVIMDNNILSVPWIGPGSGNVVADPRLDLNVLEGTAVANVTAAQLRAACRPLPDSPAIGTGFGGRNIGALGPHGIAISGEPIGTNASTSATLFVGPGGTFNWGTLAPQPWGWTAFKWKLDNGSWSAEIPVSNNSPFTNPAAINLSGLGNGPHTVYVTGKNDAGFYQDDTFVYPTNAGVAAQVTASRTWTVDPSYVPPATPRVRINEVLAKNVSTFNNAGTFPDMIELYNYGSVAVDLVDMSLTDSAASPRKFVFPPGTPPLVAGGYLVLYADNASAAPGIHLGFSLKQNGDDVSLFDKLANGGGLVDTVSFGIQLDDFSIGRMPSGEWTLCSPTFGAANVDAPLADYHGLKINEWLADAQFAANNDFLELYNPGASPSMLGGLFLSDAAGAPAKNPIQALSFIGGNGFASFVADGDAGQGADHLNFKLSPDVGLVLLSAPDLTTIDAINYGPQQTDVSQGRSPSGSDTLTAFPQPTSGGPNPGPAGVVSVTNVTQTVVPLLGVTTSSWHYNNGGVDLGTTWRAVSYNDAAWSSGFGMLGFEATPQEYPYPFQTTIPAPDQVNGHNTVYYRTHFQWDGSLTDFSLISTNYVDDGAVYYLNGAEVARLRIAAGAVTFATLASNASEPAMDVITFPTNGLVVGDNVMAVEVHQVSCCGAGTSSDDVFGMSLAAVHFTTNIVTQTFGVPLVLNEIMARNRSVTNYAGHTADYIEIYNPSTNAVDLSDLSLSNDPNQPRKFVFPASTSIAASGYYLVYCDDASPVTATNTGFALGAKGDSVFFFHRPSAGGALLDGVTFGLQTADYSIGRSPDGVGNWTLTTPTPGLPNNAAGLGSVAALKVNEWMADPASGSDWFEIYNTGAQPVAIGGLYLTDDLANKTQSPVPPLSFIGTGANAFVQFIADGNASAGADHVTFSLKKTGEAVAIFSPAQILIDGVSFVSQQTGVSQGRFPDGATNVVSFAQTASPEERNFLPLSNAVVNELLSHTDPPLEDAVEFYNPGGGDANIGGWYLSNSQDDLKKYRIADGTIIPAGGFRVFYEYQFNPTNGSSVPFTFNSAHGDRVFLSQADAAGNLTGYRAAATFGAAMNGVSFERFTNSAGAVEFVAASGRSFGVDNPATVAQFRTGVGAANPSPLVGPVVINEIMYQSATGGGSLVDENTAEEFIELRNITASSVPLFDPAATTNTWKVSGGVGFTFPQNVTLPAGGYLLLVNFDPVANATSLGAFRAKYGVSGSVPVYGPYSGNLNNTGESIALFKPDPPQLPPHPDAGFVPYVLVEEINYSALSPWPAGAAGTGNSLQRKVGTDFGDDPANWIAASPTAGAPNAVTTPGDTDGDGLPDAWEVQYFGSISDPRATPNADPDGDGFTNLQEYLAGTSPVDVSSVLKIDAVNVGTSSTAIQFAAVAGKTYSIVYRDDIGSGVWLKLADVPGQASNGEVTVNDPGTVNVRFYRLVTPALP